MTNNEIKIMLHDIAFTIIIIILDKPLFSVKYWTWMMYILGEENPIGSFNDQPNPNMIIYSVGVGKILWQCDVWQRYFPMS